MTQRHDFTLAGKAFAQEMMKHEKPKPTIVESFGWLILEIFLIVFAGAAFCAVYNWIIPEIYTSLPNINVPQAIGIRLITMWAAGNIKAVRSNEEDRNYHFWMAIGAILMFLLVGFIIKQSI